MNKREKIMVAIIAVVGLLAAGRAVKMAYVGKLETIEKEVNSLEQKITQINYEKEQAGKGIFEWMDTGRQTLSMNLNETKELWRDELNKLTAESGLSQAVTNLSQMDDIVGKNGVRMLKCKVDAEGNLQQIVQFLFKVYRQPYLVRCTDLELKAVDEKKRPGWLKMSTRFDTLILPANKMVRKIIPAELAKDKRKDVADRLAFANLDDYQKSIKPELFERFKPTPKPTPSPPPTPPTGQRNTPGGPRPTPAPTPTPRPPDSDLVLGRILSSPRGQQVILRDPNPNNKNAEEKRVEVGQALYGGTLVFVHPTGAVSDKDGSWRFHPMGLPLSQCKPLDQQAFPAVFHELTKLKQRTEGISKKEG